MRQPFIDSYVRNVVSFGMAIVIAKNAEAGRRYRCVDTGDVIEICAKQKDIRNGELVPMLTADGTFVHVNAISNDNKRIKDGKNILMVPAFFKLEPYEGPYLKAPQRRLVHPKPKPGAGKMGRRPKGDSPWRGWAFHVRHDMERLLEVIEAEEFWVVETFHYFRVGFMSKTCIGIFKSGQIGFPEKPEGILGSFPAKKKKVDPYMDWKLELGPIMAAEKWGEMTTMLQRHLRTFKAKVSKARRKK